MAKASAHTSLFLKELSSQYASAFPQQADIEIKPSSLKKTTLVRALFTSLLFNVLVLALFLSSSKPSSTAPPTLTWTLEAALAAERAASYNCSGNGDVFVDTLSFANPAEPHVLCECYECFQGPQCADRVENCTVTFTGGDLALLYPYWKNYNREQSTIIVPGYYRPGYGAVQDNSSFRLIPPLEEEIRILHNSTIKNAVTKNRYIVVGTGSIQLVNAAVWSYAQDNDGTYLNDVVAASPYYFLFISQTRQFENMKYRWAGDAHNWTRATNTSAIEIVTDPTNPIGDRSSTLENETLIYDHAYDWPHFIAITEPADHDVMLFSITKSLGFAGTRLGWAIVKNETIYNRMVDYVANNIIGVSRESQLRAFQLLRTVNNAYSQNGYLEVYKNKLLSKEEYGEKGLVFHYAYLELRERWVRISEVLNGTNRFVLQHLDSEYCNFFKEEHQPSPAFAWIQCTRDVDAANCKKVFDDAKIIVRAGSQFDSTDDYVRLSLMTRIASFDTMIEYLKGLVMASL